MKIHYKSIIIVLVLILTMTGCKKSPEELAKEQELQNKKLAFENINSVYQLGSSGLAFYVDRENAQRLRDSCMIHRSENEYNKYCMEYMNYWGNVCFDFKPKEGKALVKFHKHSQVYNLEVKTKGEFEYVLTYESKDAVLKLELTTNASNLFAKTNLIIPDDKSGSGDIGNMDLVYAYESSSNHGRFNTLEECEAQNVKDDELSKSLREQKSTCEGPGC
ncbi:lipoprotein, tandem type [Leptospira interrogans]|uniref:Lipoprotein n=8 Tax=Leptospira interrogans TaxID=173 RepID=A0A0M5L726_LEPIR|nr:lipoprotein, tandem type [Leptospira interrogans]ALE37836.1 lipoprotein [Leptospira interrogans serovar Hardjo str. Norma]EKO23663.1 putative lipoprotein [Leptospira interrogans str. UI 12621]EKO94523.1 putative lipoprotein [Leptospira interrogans str. Brem 329]EKR84634.1 putative lipoprotein [Leptospira interrogans str. UI 08452]EMN33826.1 putative lipoprotein [Leptospira interrogans serovar Medanensis str. L0448]